MNDGYESDFFGGVYLGPDGCGEDFEDIECLLPNGILLELPVHPDDEVVQIKQLVLNRATTDGKPHFECNFQAEAIRLSFRSF